MAAVLVILLLLQIAPVFSIYVFVPQWLNWPKAQLYCRMHHTDLAVISSQEDLDDASAAIGKAWKVWIGLKRNLTGDWVWSSGGEVSMFFWAANQPQWINYQNGAMYNGEWYKEYSYNAHPFLCSDVGLMTNEMTWMEALDNCKKSGGNLAIPRDSTDLMLIGRELSKMSPREYVWMGLHFFAGEWLWMNGHSVDIGDLPQCPRSGMGCGALRVETLQVSSINFPASETNLNDMNSVNGNFGSTDRSSYDGIDIDGEGAAEEQVLIYHWTHHHCNARLRFICN